MVDQHATIEEMLENHGLMEANGILAPIGEEAYEVEKDLKTVPRQIVEPTIRDFQSLVGSLLWVARSSRPNISFAVHKATRCTQKPTMSDWKLTKRVARNLKETKNLKPKMIVPRNEGNRVNLASWSDSDYVADMADPKSVTGGVLTMDGAIVQWVCKTQTGVSRFDNGGRFYVGLARWARIAKPRELMRKIGFKWRPRYQCSWTTRLLPDSWRLK